MRSAVLDDTEAKRDQASRSDAPVREIQTFVGGGSRFETSGYDRSALI